MRKKILNVFFLLALGLSPFALTNCHKIDEDAQRSEIEMLKKRIEEVDSSVKSFDEKLQSFQKILSGKPIVGVEQVGNDLIIELSDTTSFQVSNFAKVGTIFPKLSVDEEGYWTFSVDKGKSFANILTSEGKKMRAIPAVDETAAEIIIPKLKIDSSGYWVISTDGGKSYERMKDDSNNDIKAEEGEASDGLIEKAEYDSKANILHFELSNGRKLTFHPINTFYLKIEKEEKEFIALGQERTFAVVQGDVKEAYIKAPEGWKVSLDEKSLKVTAPEARDLANNEYTIRFVIISSKGYMRIVPLKLNLTLSKIDENACEIFKKFQRGDDDNVLLDFSYAGYKHGEVAPPDVNTLGYKTYDITKYGADPTGKKSSREALINIIEKLTGTRDLAKANAGKVKAIIYFPEGEYILHDKNDNVKGSDNIMRSVPILIRMSDIVFKGAGREKTFITMADPMLPDAPDKSDPRHLYSSPKMLMFKHNSNGSRIADVVSDAAKGSFSVEVSSTVNIRVGDWVVLHVLNKKPEFVDKELAPYRHTDLYQAADASINKKGVLVNDRHQVVDIKGNTITFKEPIMHTVEAKYGWEIHDFPHYENVGIEDLTFKGNAKKSFYHHDTWQDDGAYKPLDMMRLTNSWMRNVGFISVSEAASVVNCANVSVYNIEIKGNRGHSAIRSQGSSRVFLGGIYDHSDGRKINGNIPFGGEFEGLGQYHAPGVSKESMGAVLYKVDWGTDACFEAHASQPRATLIDCSTGALMPSRQGGAVGEMPNHLNDLTLWNFNAKLVPEMANNWIWWNRDNVNRRNHNWRFVMPIIVGQHGAPVKFDQQQVKADEGHGSPVEPYSLYEAQLKNRLGHVPAWLSTVKAK